MKKIVILFVVAALFTSCEEKEPTCIECYKQGNVVFNGCIEEYNSQDVESLERVVNQIIDLDHCEHY